MKYVILILFMLTVACSTNKENLNCKSYRKGFYTYEGRHSEIVIYRENNHQIEYDTVNDEWILVKIFWTGSCKYTFTFIDTNMIDVKQHIGRTVDVKILSGNANGYHYHSILKQGNEEFKGKIVMLNDEIDESTLVKIKSKLKELSN